MRQISFESLKVGDRLPALTLPPITRQQLALYYGGSGDYNPIHVDIDFAKAAGMSDVFAHGMLSMAFMAQLLTRWVPQSAVISFGVRFQAITWIGDEITVDGRVVDIDLSKRHATVELNCVNQRFETTLQGTSTMG